MKQIIILSLTIILLSACRNLAKKESKDDLTIKSFILPENAIPIVKTEYILIKGSVDSVQGNFVLDTGADKLCLDSAFHSAGKLKNGISNNIRISGIGNSSQKLTIIRDSVNFSSGNFGFRTSNVLILDLKPIGGDFIDGLLGMNSFMLDVLEINYAIKYIDIHKTIDSVDISDFKKISMERIKKFICVPLIVKINDSATIKGNFILDTGTPGSTLTSSVVEKNNLDKKISRKVRYYTKYGGIGGESSSYDFIADSLQISGYRLGKVNMSYSLDSSGLLAGGEYIGILGNNILERFDILFDFRNNNLYLRPNEEFNTPFISDRLGFSYVDRFKTLGGWIVAGLYENSAAEKQGLKIDDKIISVNEIPVEKITYDTQIDLFKNLNKVRFVIERSGNLKTIEFDLVPLL